MKPSHATTNEWNTKEDSGKSLKNALHVLQAKPMLNSKKIKPVALAVIEFMLV